MSNSIDIQWSLLTDASHNFGNALANSANVIRQRRDQSRDRETTANYLLHPDDPTARSAAFERNPTQAFQIEDHHIERARGLRDDQRQQLDMIGQLLTGPDGRPIGPEAYPQALAMAHQAGIDITGHETYDPNFVNGAVQLHQRLQQSAHPQQPTNIEREVNYYRSIGRDDLAQQLQQRHAQGPPSVVSNGDGTFTILPQSVIQGQQGAPQGHPNEAQLRAQAAQAIANGADPAQVNARLNQMLQGGPPPAGAGNF